jgi:prepilin-type N-terminal cleavage/methylation domain-containing protein
MLTTLETGAAKLRSRLVEEESGYTLVELLIVMVILAILLSIAVPSYLGFKVRAERAASFSTLRTGIPAAEGYYADNGTYVGMTETILKASYDSGIRTSGSGALIITSALARGYSMTSTVGACTATYNAPGTAITNTC